jgi:hypothetical protein
MIALRLDVIANPGLGRDQRPRIRSTLLPRRPALHVSYGRVKARYAFRNRRRIVGQLDQFGTTDAEVGEHGVGEDLRELGRATAVAALGREGFHVDVEAFGQPQQDTRGHRPLIAFEVIEIGCRDPKLVRHLALIEPTVAAQSLQSCAEKELALQHRCEVVTIFTKSQVMI